MSRRFAARRSGIHGKGVFALVDIAKGEELLPYGGEVVDWEFAQARYDAEGITDGHTFFFDIGDGRVIDGGHGGNTARFINHGCAPNCEAVFVDDTHLVIQTRRKIKTGEELLIDYQLEIDDPADAFTVYRCGCGAKTCRGTMAGNVRA